MVRSEGSMSLKNSVTTPGIDPGTVRLVAQRLNHYATPGPVDYAPNLLSGFRDIVVRTLSLPTREHKQNQSTDIRLRAAMYWGRRCKILEL
jgi:hypothetical protein